MKLLTIHNSYKSPGGEDAVVAAEKKLLFKNGHNLHTLIVKNDILDSFNYKVKVIKNSSYSFESKSLVSSFIKTFKPDIAHTHNFFPILTPSIYDACIEADVPVVQTLHNYRTICAGALLLRKGKVCEKCIKGTPYQATIYRCYRNSILGSLAVARMVSYHRKRKTWQHKVDRFIALTHFSKQKFVEAGFPVYKISVKPNFYFEKADPGDLRPEERLGSLFVGRLSPEKGIGTLLAAWTKLEDVIPLRIAGDGPLLEKIKARNSSSVKFLGQLPLKQISQEMKRASFLLMPSEWYEGFPMVLVEAFAHGVPVLASRLGSMAEIVEDRVTGLLFKPGDPLDLAEKAKWMFEHPNECRRMGENARKEYEAKYTSEINYQQLMAIYQEVIEEHKRGKTQNHPNS